MCSAPKPPKPPAPPPPPPPPPQPAPVAPILQDSVITAEGRKRSKDSTGTAKGGKRSGANALRIDLNVPQPSGNGLNIPRG